MEDVKEDDEEFGIYYGDIEMYWEESNELESARGEAMVENAIALEE